MGGDYRIFFSAQLWQVPARAPPVFSKKNHSSIEAIPDIFLYRSLFPASSRFCRIFFLNSSGILALSRDSKAS